MFYTRDMSSHEVFAPQVTAEPTAWVPPVLLDPADVVPQVAQSPAGFQATIGYYAAEYTKNSGQRRIY